MGVFFSTGGFVLSLLLYYFGERGVYKDGSGSLVERVVKCEGQARRWKNTSQW